MSDPRRTLLIAIAIVSAGCSLVGCAGMPFSPAQLPSTRQSTPNPMDSTPAPVNWPKVDESGVGPTTITVENPSPDAAYLDAHFQWSDGEGSVELVEDPNIFMSGRDGGSGGYQMTLPTDSEEYTFKIDVGPDSTFSFSGTFITGE